MVALTVHDQTLKDHIPPQQGLRLSILIASAAPLAQRPYPTTTRIKTKHLFLLDMLLLKDHIPPQQGLRPISAPSRTNSNGLKDHIPPQQGLRQLANFCITTAHSSLKDHIPPQQGLRRI